MCEWQVKLCDPTLTSAISESLRDKSIIKINIKVLFIRSFVIAGRGPAYSGPQR